MNDATHTTTTTDAGRYQQEPAILYHNRRKCVISYRASIKGLAATRNHKSCGQLEQFDEERLIRNDTDASRSILYTSETVVCYVCT